jgi:hypothetical protein
MMGKLRLELGREQAYNLIEPSWRGAADQRDGGRQIEINDVEYVQLAPMLAMLELPVRDKTQSAAVGEQRELKVFAEDRLRKRLWSGG